MSSSSFTSSSSSSAAASTTHKRNILQSEGVLEIIESDLLQIKGWKSVDRIWDAVSGLWFLAAVRSNKRSLDADERIGDVVLPLYVYSAVSMQSLMSLLSSSSRVAQLPQVRALGEVSATESTLGIVDGESTISYYRLSPGMRDLSPDAIKLEAAMEAQEDA